MKIGSYLHRLDGFNKNYDACRIVIIGFIIDFFNINCKNIFKRLPVYKISDDGGSCYSKIQYL